MCIRDRVKTLAPTADYLAQAEAVMPADHPWLGRAAATILGSWTRGLPTAKFRFFLGKARARTGSYFLASPRLKFLEPFDAEHEHDGSPDRHFDRNGDVQLARFHHRRQRVDILLTCV